MTELKDGVTNPPDEEDIEVGEHEAQGTILGKPRMTPALNNLERLIDVTGLALQHPHDYNVNVMSWDNVDRLKLPKHTRCARLLTLWYMGNYSAGFWIRGIHSWGICMSQGPFF